MRRIFLLTVVFIGTSVIPVLCQKDSLEVLLKKFRDHRERALQEKIFVHTDRTFYLTGETMWLKLYCVDATLHKPLEISKVVYVELLDNDNKVALQTKLSLQKGNGSGSIFLPASLVSGNYKLRAYTQWMRNFSPEFYFQQPVTLINPFTSLGLKPETSKADYDIQFFAEGGHLVEGITSKMAFRAVDRSGKGVDFKGAILNESNDSIAVFSPLKFGLGQFNFTPMPGQHYKAVIRDIHGAVINTTLPTIDREGYVISVRDTSNNRILVRVAARLSHTVPVPFVYLFAHTRNVTGFAQAHVLSGDQTIFLVDKAALGDGISHLTLFDHQLKPVCERLYFKRPANPLTIEVQSSKAKFRTREKVDLKLLAASNGKPAKTDLSISVYREDSLYAPHCSGISAFLWLTSELKGVIESPESYLESTTSSVAIENLMLTHGWSRFKWEDVLSDDQVVPAFLPEYRGHLVHGRVTSMLTGKPASGISTTLSTPGKSIQLYLNKSDEEGRVQYEMQDFFGIRRIILQPNTEIDSTFRIEITSPYSTVFSSDKLPEFRVAEKLKDAIAARSLSMQLHSIFFEENNRTIDREIDTVAFYGLPDESYFLDDFTRFPTMEEVMREYVPGVMVRKRKDRFMLLTINKDNNTLFRNNPLVLLDGVPVYNMNKIMEFDPRKVQKLDVMTHKYFLGHLSFDGVVSYTTYLGDLSDFELNPLALSVNYEGLQQKREFFSPRYESPVQKESRIPDPRDLLFWSPEIGTDNTGSKLVDFYSSDIPGTYRVVVQGISSDGMPCTGSFTIQVDSRESY